MAARRRDRGGGNAVTADHRRAKFAEALERLKGAA